MNQFCPFQPEESCVKCAENEPAHDLALEVTPPQGEVSVVGVNSRLQMLPGRRQVTLMPALFAFVVILLYVRLVTI